MSKINILWMYPDILNNYGDRANIQAIERVCSMLNIETEVKRVEHYGEEIDFLNADIVMFNAGEYRTMPHIIKDLYRYREDLTELLNRGKYIFTFNLTGSVFGTNTYRADGTSYEGLSMLPISFSEKKVVYGDDALVKVSNLNLLGTQIQMGNVTLTGEAFAEVIYGYGNDYKSKLEGARKNNLIFTNLSGPLFVKNPWFVEYVVRDILKMENLPDNYEFNIDDFTQKYPVESESYRRIKNYIDTKRHPSSEDMEGLVK